MSLHSSFNALLKARPSGFMYLQHELSDHIDIDRLEKMMQRIILKCNEILKDDRRSYAPMFTFHEVNTEERNYIRMNIHRPGLNGEPDGVIGHFDFVEVRHGGYSTLDLAINKWGLLTRQIHKDLTAHGARTVMNSLMDYMDPIEYALAIAPVKEMLRLPAPSRVGIHFNIEVTHSGVNLIIMRKDKILVIQQVNVENKEI